GADPSGGYVQWEGTSGAAPIVAGIAALVRSAHPAMSADDVVNRLIRTAHPVGRSPSTSYGYGLGDARAAVTATVPSVTENPLGSLSEWVRMHRRAAPSSSPAPVPTRTPASAVPLPPERTGDAAIVTDWRV